MKKIIVAVMLVAIMTCSLFAFAGCETADYVVGVVQFEPHIALDRSYEGFKTRLTELITADGKTVKFDYNNANGDVANATTVSETMVNKNVDMIFAIATPTAQAAAASTSRIPIVFTAVTSPENAGLVKSNITGTTDLNDIESQVRLMKMLVPGAKKFGILYTTSEPNSLIQRDMAKKLMVADGIEVVEGGITETDNIEQVLQRFDNEDVECVFIPTDNKIATAAATVHTCNKGTTNLPIVCGETGMNDACGVATYGVDYYAIGVRAAEIAYDILTGKKNVKDIRYENPAANQVEISINENVAKQIGFTIPQSVLDLKK